LLLADQTIGFNPAVAQFASEYGIQPITIDFAKANKVPNLFEGFLDPTQLIQSGTVKFPCACIYNIQSKNLNTQKFQTFSGQVTVGLDIHLSFPKTMANQDFETIADVVIAALYQTLNQDGAEAYWASGVLYNGDVECSRTPVLQTNSSWGRAIRLLATFEVVL
jgi:hypothetical protein